MPDLRGRAAVRLPEPDGRRGYILILEYQKKLFIGEANVDMDAPPPLQFQQTFYMMDEKGDKIRLEGGEYDREEKTNPAGR